jgi:hypothetical protein
LNALAITSTPGRTTRTEWFAEAVRIAIADPIHPDDTHTMKERKRARHRKYIGELLAAKLIGLNGEAVTYLPTA